LDAFSDHAKRKQINQADVLLCARRNPDLVARLNRELTTSVSTAKKRAKKSSNNNNDEEA
jgi:hypothetical protein